MFALFDDAVGVAHHLVSLLASVVTPFVGGADTVVAIVAFTVGVRLALFPLSRAAARATRARSALAPRLADLRKRHGRDPVRLRRESADLYRSHGISPFAGILPSLVQLPVFAVMYRLFVSPTVGGLANALLTHTVFGVPLGSTVATAGLAAPPVLVYLGLFALLVGVGWWSSRQARRALTPETPAPLARVAPLLPYATVAVAAFVPLAAGIYLLVTTAWTALEREVFGTHAAPAASR